MLQSKFKSLLAVLCVLACIAGFSQGAVSSVLAEDAEAVALPTFDLPNADPVTVENDALKLVFDQTDCTFTVTNKANGYVWYSNPVGREEDPIAKGKYKKEMGAMLLVYYINKNELEDSVNSYTGAVTGKHFTVKGIENGVRIDYEFDYEKFSIPVEIQLQKDHLQARIIADEIREDDVNIISRIELLPYFGATSTEDEGYMLVPDGSGSLINFNNGKTTYAAYDQRVYGRDINTALIRQVATTRTAHLPVFGISNANGNGVLGVITENTSAEIMANVSGNKTSYNTVRACYQMRCADTYTLGSTIGSRVKTINIYEEGGINVDVAETSYFFLSGEDSDYSGMAKRYRAFLTEQGSVQGDTSKTELFLELYGAAEVTKSVLGIQTDVIEPITPYSDAEAILRSLKEAGVGHIAVRYVNADENAIRSKVPTSISLPGALGGKKAFRSLLKYCQENDIDLYLDREMQVTDKWGNGYISFFNGAQTISGTLAVREIYGIQLMFKTTASGLLTVGALDKLSDKVLKSLNKWKDQAPIGVSLGTFGTDLYSDFRQVGWTRRDSEDLIARISAKFEQAGFPVMATGANLPATMSANRLINVSVSSSRFDITDCSVPFYQMVFSGLKSYAASPANLRAGVTDSVLQAIETGSMITFNLSNVDYTKLAGTRYDHLYSIGFNDYKDDAVAAYKTLDEVYAKTDHSAVKRHAQLTRRVARTEYENGAVVYVNYTEEDYAADGVIIPAKGYLVKGGN